MIPRAPMPPEAAGPGWRLSNWPFAAKMGLAPALALLGVLLLGAVGTLAVRRQSDLLDGVVRLDLRTATVLSQSVAELQAANGGLYRLLTLRAAHAPDVDITTQITGLATRVETVRGRLADIEAQPASMGQAIAARAARADLARYRDMIRVVGSMLELDFPSAVAVVRPFDANARRMMIELSQWADDSIHDATRRAEESQRAEQRTRQVFLATVLGVAVLVVGCAAEIARRTVRSVRRIARATLLVASGDQTLKVENAGAAR